ncbi:Crp/Fnr family transcriptional regulator [Actinomadura fibrosa]|uniref:Crp/Fnr family transcriptional regulator n=1 Tax=Actinomadura fibrosa TaxID=111802 RepID=A0ABW2XI31_9ACTN|nr:Crp/Fnr family transcriptional regulator [Actinomadura fibrosa]
MVEDTSIRIMDVLTEEQRVALEALGEPVKFPAECTIFWEGQPSHSVLIIQEGHLKVTRTDAGGNEVILAVRGENEIMGEEGVLMGEPRSATVTTITPVSGLDIGADDLLCFVDQHRLWVVMYRAAVRRRRQSDQRAMLARLDVKSRLARWLLELADEVGEPVEDGWAIGATLSQQDFAGRIGASRDAVAIELRRFRDQGLVTTGRRRIVLHDLEALRQISLI